MYEKELIDKVLRIKESRWEALKAKNYQMAEELLVELSTIMNKLPSDTIKVIGIY